jgi:type I restriction enzyme S subunit|tara:strand:+ start:167 stop:1309 length:1143 start_codon:yes stop_codon:yes gene_type:complete
MNQDWKIINLGKICDVLDSKRKPITKRDRIPGDYPYYGATGIVDWVNDYIFDEQLILLGEDGAKWDSGERSAFNINGKTWVNNHAHVLRPHRDVVKDNWLVYYLNHQSLLPFITGLTVPKLNQGKMRGIPILVPPLPEQKRIVTKLDKCFEAIDKARANVQRNLQNAKELFQSQLNQIFSQKGDGWVEKKLGKSSIIMYGFTTKASRQVSEVKILRITDIQSGSVNWSNVPYCNIGKDDYAKYELKVGDIVFARTGATTGKSYLISKPPKAVFASYLIRVQVNPDEIDPQFLYQFFQTSIYWDLINKGISGSAQGGFNATKLKALIIHYPKSTQEQTQIIETLKGWEESTKLLQSNYQQELDALDELKKSILEKAFNGEL